MESPWLIVPTDVTRLTYKYAGLAAHRFRQDRAAEICFDDPAVGRILVKQADAPLKPLANVYDWPGSVLGGPNALTRTLTGAALGSAMGYGGGWLMEHLFPDKYIDRGKLRRNLAILGGLSGGAIPAYFFGRPAVAQDGMAGWTKTSADYSTVPAPFRAIIGTDEQPARQTRPGVLKAALDRLQVNEEELVDECLEKAAISAGGAFLPRIPVDQWNNVMLRAPGVSPPIRAAAAGLVNAAAASHGGAKLVSPFDVGRIAMGMGSGAVSGMLVGKTIGALAGLAPDAQDAVFKAGVGAGLLANVVPLAFGR